MADRQCPAERVEETDSLPLRNFARLERFVNGVESPSDRKWLRDAVARYVVGRASRTLEQETGLEVGHKHPPLHEQIRRRDAARVFAEICRRYELSVPAAHAKISDFRDRHWRQGRAQIPQAADGFARLCAEFLTLTRGQLRNERTLQRWRHQTGDPMSSTQAADLDTVAP